ncbi:hypothetical protein Tco_0247238 [Tanacetum coccineum]
MFDEYFNTPSSAVSLIPVAGAPRAVDIAGSPSSTTIDLDVPLTSSSSTNQQQQSLIISQESSSNVQSSHSPLELIEPNNFKESMLKSSWIEALQEEIHEFERLQVWELVPFTPANIHTIEAFMNRVGYQGVVDKVSDFFIKNLAQPWQTMFKVFNRCLTRRTSGHDQTKINILQLFHAVINQTHVDYAALLWWDFVNNVFQKKEAIQYPRFTKLIIADLMKKFPNIPKRIEKDYHSIKDDVPLVMETDDFKKYKTMLMKVAVSMNQPQPVFSIQGTNRNTPRAHRSPTNSANPLEMKKRKQTVGESSSPRKSLKITIKQRQRVKKDDDDSKDRIEPRSHKENPEFVVDDDDKENSLEIRNEETQTTIPTPPSSLRKILSSDKKTNQELMDIVSIPTITTSKHLQVKKRISSKYSHLPGTLRRMCRRQGYMIQDMERLCVTTANLWETHNKIDDIPHEILKRSLQDRANDIELWKALRCKFEKSSPSNTSCREDDFHSQHDEHQDDDAPPEGEKRVKRKENVIDEDEVIPKDETPELIVEFQNVDKVVPTIFNRARIEVTLKDTLSNQFRNAKEYAYHLEQSTNFTENQIVWESRQQDIPHTIPKTLIFYGPQRNPNEPPRYLYNKDLFLLKYGNTKERKYILSLHKIKWDV